ncbi:17111_t:CDS:2 [Rhizophagus irregularis]|nr:17111_t:CDS:2 [Rhizophagus irregularis]
MSQKNPQDASELTKCLRRPSRCFRTDEMSQKINKERKGDF